MGIGVIIRNPMREMLASLHSPKCNSLDPTMVESFVALRAVVFAKEMGWQKVELEGDALQVIMALRKDNKNWSRYGQVIDDTRIVLNSFQ